MSRSSWRRCALTLIEVVLGLALLSTLLVGLMLGFGRHARQLRLAQRQIRATSAADQLLSQWFASADGIPTAARGTVPDQDGITWQTQPLGAPDLWPWGAQLVRLTLHEQRTGAHARQPATNAAPIVLVSVDVVVPLPSDLLDPNVDDATPEPVVN